MDLSTEQIERISVAASIASTFDVALSRDGSAMAFAVPGGFSRRGVFHYDVATNALTAISAGRETQDRSAPDTDKSGLAISADGRYVVFMSAATNLADRDLPACAHWSWTDVEFPDCRHVYLYERQSGQTELISISGQRIPGNKASMGGAISAGGRWVVFTSLADNLADTPLGECDFPLGDGTCPQVYLRDRENDLTYLVSQGHAGQPADGASFNGTLSPSGRYVTFGSHAGNITWLSPPPDAGAFGQRSRLYLFDLSR